MDKCTVAWKVWSSKVMPSTRPTTTPALLTAALGLSHQYCQSGPSPGRWAESSNSANWPTAAPKRPGPSRRSTQTSRPKHHFLNLAWIPLELFSLNTEHGRGEQKVQRPNTASEATTTVRVVARGHALGRGFGGIALVQRNKKSTAKPNTRLLSTPLARSVPPIHAHLASAPRTRRHPRQSTAHPGPSRQSRPQR